MPSDFGSVNPSGVMGRDPDADGGYEEEDHRTLFDMFDENSDRSGVN